ncbi:3-oxoacyl-ACP synthase [Streptomyces griseoviridis]
MGIGIGAVHCLAPEKRVRIADLPACAGLEAEALASLQACGVRTVAIHPDTDACELAIRACRELLADHPHEPDFLIHIESRASERLAGSDACRVQAGAGLTSAVPFTVGGLACVGPSAAWALAHDLLLADPARRSILLAFGTRPAEDKRIRYPASVLGDGAFAMTIVREGRPALKASRMSADGSFNDRVHVDYVKAPWHEWGAERAVRERLGFDLAMESRTRLAQLVDETLTDAGLARDDVAAAVLQNLPADASPFFEQALGLPIHPICAEQLAERGNLGPMGAVLSLDRLLTTAGLRSGDHVLILSRSRGAAWAVTLWEA